MGHVHDEPTDGDRLEGALTSAALRAGLDISERQWIRVLRLFRKNALKAGLIAPDPEDDCMGETEIAPHGAS